MSQGESTGRKTERSEQREVAQDLSASVTRHTEDTPAVRSMHAHACKHKQSIYMRNTQPHTPPARAVTARPQLQTSLTGHKSDPDGLMVDL